MENTINIYTHIHTDVNVVVAQWPSCVWLSVTLWTTARQASLPGANTRDPTPKKALGEKTWRARRIRFSGVSKRPAHEIPPMTRSQGESLTGKADQVFRDFEKLPPALTLKMISVFLMPASMGYFLISLTQAGRPSLISSQIRINLEL